MGSITDPPPFELRVVLENDEEMLLFWKTEASVSESEICRESDEPNIYEWEHRSHQICTYHDRELSALKPKDAPTVPREDRNVAS